MRIVRRASEHLVDPLDQPFRNDVLELFGFVVDFVPAHAHHLHEEQLHEPMAAEHQPGELFAGCASAGRRCTARIGQA